MNIRTYRLVEDDRSTAPRPNFVWGDVWCLKCNAPCDFDITGTNRLWSKPDSEGYTKGGIYIRAEHHGEKLDIHLTHQQARHLKASKNPRIEIFGDPTLGTTDETILTIEDSPARLHGEAVPTADAAEKVITIPAPLADRSDPST
jgi:hypothetical protein